MKCKKCGSKKHSACYKGIYELFDATPGLFELLKKHQAQAYRLNNRK